jgi:hypothetical protein
MKKKQTLSVEVEKTIRLLIITLGALVTILLIVFLIQTSRNAQQGYKLEQVRLQNEQLQNVSQGLKAKVTDAAASDTFEDSNKINEMAQPEQEASKYLLPEDND